MSENPYQAPASESASKPPHEDREKLVAVAKAQRTILFTLLINIGFNIMVGTVPTIPTFVIIAGIVIALATAYFVYVLALELEPGQAVLYAIIMFVPCLSLIGLLIINQQATKYLKSRGVNVGLMGANPKDL